MITIPQISFLFLKDKVKTGNTENRQLASFPSLSINKLVNFPKGFDNFWNDNAPFRNFIIRQYNNLNYYILKNNSFNDVVVGKKDDNGLQWLFYNKVSDEDPLSYATGTREYSKQEKETIIAGIKQNTNKAQEKNIELYYFLAPNKSSIYKEYLPDNVNIINQDEPTLKMVDDVIKQGNIDNLINCYKELSEEKQDNYTYLCTDTHWNDYGAYLGVKKIVETIDNDYDYIFENVEIKDEGLYYYPGDLYNYLNIDSYSGVTEQKISIDNFLTEAKIKKQEEENITIYTNEKPIINKTIMIIGDSFRERMIPYLSKIYSKVVEFHRHDYKEAMIEKYKPDIVILEYVERASNSLENFRI